MSRTLALGVTCLLAACHVGEPLVGARLANDAGPFPAVPCQLPPTCSAKEETVLVVRAAQHRAVHPVELSACRGGALRPACSSDAEATRPDAGIEDDDAGVEDDNAGVDLDARLDLEFPQLADVDCDPPDGLPEFRALSGETLACAHRRFVFNADAAGEHVRLRGVTWTQSNLEIEARVPVVVQLDNPSVSDVHLSVTGPVELRVNAAARFDSVRLKAKRVGALRAKLSLERSDASDLLGGSAQARFEGAVDIVRSALERPQFVADEVRLESTAFDGGRIEADTLLAVDSKLADAVLVLGEAQLAAAKLMRVHVTECDALTLFRTTSLDALYPGCRSAPHRFYESTLAGGLADGEIQSEHSHFEAVRFGSREPTRLVMWTPTMMATALCGLTESAVIADGTLNCNECRQGTDIVPVEICTLWKGDRSHDNNFCELFEAAEPCENPPERERPLMDKL